jgi:hypothetical protein
MCVGRYRSFAPTDGNSANFGKYERSFGKEIDLITHCRLYNIFDRKPSLCCSRSMSGKEAYIQACARCNSKKIKCRMPGEGGTCEQCESVGAECA